MQASGQRCYIPQTFYGEAVNLRTYPVPPHLVQPALQQTLPLAMELRGQLKRATGATAAGTGSMLQGALLMLHDLAVVLMADPQHLSP
jgi:hypothetical protein